MNDFHVELSLAVKHYELVDASDLRLCICESDELQSKVDYFISKGIDVGVIPIPEKSFYFASDYPTVSGVINTNELRLCCGNIHEIK